MYKSTKGKGPFGPNAGFFSRRPILLKRVIIFHSRRPILLKRVIIFHPPLFM